MTFYELEKRCKQRRLKRIVYFVIVILLIILVILIIVFFKKSQSFKKEVKKESPKLEVKKPEKKLQNNKKEIIKKTEKPLLTPVIPSLDINKTKKVESKIKVIKITKPKNSILEVETLPSYEKCIKLANKYLKEKKYKLALKWAKNANIQNKILPESWIISAKALFYSGKKEKAIEILKIYLKYQKNKEVKNLLKEFENEKAH